MGRPRNAAVAERGVELATATEPDDPGAHEIPTGEVDPVVGVDGDRVHALNGHLPGHPASVSEGGVRPATRREPDKGGDVGSAGAGQHDAVARVERHATGSEGTTAKGANDLAPVPERWIELAVAIKAGERELAVAVAGRATYHEAPAGRDRDRQRPAHRVLEADARGATMAERLVELAGLRQAANGEVAGEAGCVRAGRPGNVYGALRANRHRG